MNITIKQVQGILLSTVMISGLAACSSSPSPWSQRDDSPWKAKRDTETTSAPAQEFVEIPVEEPAPVEPPPPPPSAIEEPAFVAPAGVIEEPIIEEAAAGGDIMSMPSSSYAVQVYAGGTEESVQRYKNAHGLDDLLTVKTDRNGSTIYVLVSVHDDRAGANQAASDLEAKTGSKPWVRSMAGLQKVAVP